MSSGGSETPTIDATAATARAVAAFFGILGFNLLLIAMALVLRRVTRPKTTEQGNSVEMKNGKYNRKKASLTDDVEKAEAHSIVESEKHIQDAEKAAAENSSAQRDNGAFVDIDLGSDSKEHSEAVYESRNKSEGANADNQYSNLSDVKVSVSSEPEDVHYENYEGGETKAPFSGTSEAEVIY